MKRALLFLALLSLTLLAPAARAHGTRSVSVEVSEVSPGNAVVHVRAQTPGDRVTVRFEAPCTSGPAAEDDGGEGALRVECPGSIAGKQVSVAGLGPILSEAILVVSLRDGT